MHDRVPRMQLNYSLVDSYSTVTLEGLSVGIYITVDQSLRSDSIFELQSGPLHDRRNTDISLRLETRK